MRESVITASSPMMTGPRMTERSMRAPSLDPHAADDLALGVDRALDLRHSSQSSSTVWLARRRSSFLPVSSHHEVSRENCTLPPSSMSLLMASVISSSPRADGLICAMASKIEGRNMIDADEREVALRLFGFLDERDRRCHSHRPRRRRTRTGWRPLSASPRRRSSVSARNLATESLIIVPMRLSPRYMTKSAPSEKRLRGGDRVGETRRAILRNVRELGVPRDAVAERGLDLVAGFGRDDDADVANAGVDEVVDHVEEDRTVRDRHELLGAGVRQRSKASAGAAGENEALHAILSRARGARVW